MMPFFILRFERFVKSDPYWTKIYRKIENKIKSEREYNRLRQKPAEQALEAFEFRLFSESNDIEKIANMSEKKLFEAFMRFFEEFRQRKSLGPVKRIPPVEYVKGLLVDLGD